MKKCPFCGERMNEETGICTGCQYNSGVPRGAGAPYTNVNLGMPVSGYDKMEASESSVGAKVGIIATIIGGYFFLTPMFGFTVGMCLLLSPKSSYRRFGKGVIIVSGVVTAISVLIVIYIFLSYEGIH